MFSVFLKETEEFDSIVSITEKLHEQVVSVRVSDSGKYTLFITVKYIMSTTWHKRERVVWSGYVPFVLEINLTTQPRKSSKRLLTP